MLQVSALVEVEGGRGAIEAFGLGVSIMNNEIVRLLGGQSSCQQDEEDYQQFNHAYFNHRI